MNTENKNEGRVVMPPEHIFRAHGAYDGQTAEERVIAGTPFYPLERIEYPSTGGIHIHFRGLKFPAKGFPFPSAIDAVNDTKRIIRAMVKPLTRRELTLSWIGFAVLPWKKKLKVISAAIDEFLYASEYSMNGIYLEERYMTPTAYSIFHLVEGFLAGLGVTDDRASRVARVMAHIVEYDDAYRYRLQDAVDSVDPHDIKMNQPRAIKKIFRTIVEREQDKKVRGNTKSLEKMINLILFHPRVRKAITKPVYLYLDIMVPDDADHYHFLHRAGYYFGGLTDEERWKKWHEVHDGKLPEQQFLEGIIKE